MIKIKNRKVYVIGVMFICIIFLCLFFTPMMKLNVSAEGLLSNGNSGALYDRYPFMNYSLDWYVDTSGNLFPWNWGKAITDGVFSILCFLFNLMYLATGYLFSLGGRIIQEVYSLDLINSFSSMLESFVQEMAGVTKAGLRGSGLFPGAIRLIVIFTAISLMWKAFVKRESGEALSRVFVFFLILIASIGFFMNAGAIVKVANTTATELQNVVISPVTKIMGVDSKDVGTGIRDQYFRATIYEPYLLLQFDTINVSDAKADSFLSFAPGSEERDEMVKSEVSNGNTMMDSWTGLSLKFLNWIILVFVNLVAFIIVLLFSVISIWHQLMFVLYIFVSPFVLLAALIPGREGTALNWFGKAIYELVMKVMVTMLLTIMFMMQKLLMSLADNVDYIFFAFIICIVYVAVFLFRNKIIDLILNRGRAGGNKLRGLLAAGYMAHKLSNGGVDEVTECYKDDTQTDNYSYDDDLTPDDNQDLLGTNGDVVYADHNEEAGYLENGDSEDLERNESDEPTEDVENAEVSSEEMSDEELENQEVTKDDEESDENLKYSNESGDSEVDEELEDRDGAEDSEVDEELEDRDGAEDSEVDEELEDRDGAEDSEVDEELEDRDGAEDSEVDEELEDRDGAEDSEVDEELEVRDGTENSGEEDLENREDTEISGEELENYDKEFSEELETSNRTNGNIQGEELENREYVTEDNEDVDDYNGADIPTSSGRGDYADESWNQYVDRENIDNVPDNEDTFGYENDIKVSEEINGRYEKIADILDMDKDLEG